MAIFRDYARKKRTSYFINDIDKNSKILEIGSGSQWFANIMKEHGFTNYEGIDIVPPADIVGDIRKWKELGLKPESFDCIIAFEVVEHVDIFQECYDLLKDDGVLMLTTPLPCMDWLLKILEKVGLNQKRTSPHDHLVYLKDVKLFKPFDFKYIFFLGQWGKFRKNIHYEK
jgi:2-polyprenyl-3-methyl-5-hydroxy-6-metoxy-1,4-benzoquinol methylase